MTTLHLDWHGFGKVITHAGNDEPPSRIHHGIGCRLHEPPTLEGSLEGNEETYALVTIVFRRVAKDDLHDYNYVCAGCVQCQPTRLTDLLTTVVRKAASQAVHEAVEAIKTGARERARELAALRAARLRHRAIAKKAATARWRRR